MKSHEIMKSVVGVVGTKEVAFALNTSASLVYKWCAPWNPEDRAGTTRNPLDRVLELVECTDDRRPVEWLCREVGGIYVDPSSIESEVDLDAECIRHTQTLLSEFSDLLQVISLAMADESGIDRAEAEQIREKWHRLQSQGETFVRACERGLFNESIVNDPIDGIGDST